MHCFQFLFSQVDNLLSKGELNQEERSILESLPKFDKYKAKSLNLRLQDTQTIQIYDLINYMNFSMQYSESIVQNYLSEKIITKDSSIVIILLEAISLFNSIPDLVDENILKILKLFNKIKNEKFLPVTAFIFNFIVNHISRNWNIYYNKEEIVIEILKHYGQNKFLSSEKKMDKNAWVRFIRLVIESVECSGSLERVYREIYNIYRQRMDITKSINNKTFISKIKSEYITFNYESVKLFIIIVTDRDELNDFVDNYIDAMNSAEIEAFYEEKVNMRNIPTSQLEMIQNTDIYKECSYSAPDELNIEDLMPENILKLAKVIIEAFESCSETTKEYFFTEINEKLRIIGYNTQRYILIAFCLLILKQYPLYSIFLTNLLENYGDIFNESETIFGPVLIRAHISTFRNYIIRIVNEDENSNFVAEMISSKGEALFFASEVLQRCLESEIKSKQTLSFSVIDMVIRNTYRFETMHQNFKNECDKAISTNFMFIIYFIYHSDDWSVARTTIIDHILHFLYSHKYTKFILREFEAILECRDKEDSQTLLSYIMKEYRKDVFPMLIKSTKKTIEEFNERSPVAANLLPFFFDYLKDFPTKACFYDVLDILALVVSNNSSYVLSDKFIAVLLSVMKILEPKTVTKQTLQRFLCLISGTTFITEPINLFIYNKSFATLAFVVLGFEENFIDLLEIFKNSVRFADGNAVSLSEAYISDFLLQIILESRKKTRYMKVVYSGVSYDINIHKSDIDKVIDLFFSILQRSPEEKIIEKLILHLETTFDAYSAKLLEKLRVVIEKSYYEMRPCFLLSDKVVCRINSEFNKIFKSEFTFSVWLNIDNKVLAISNAEIVLLHLKDDSGKEFRIVYHEGTIDALLRVDRSQTRVTLLRDFFNVTGWNLYTFNYRVNGNRASFKSWRNNGMAKQSEFIRLGMQHLTEILFCYIEHNSPNILLGYVGPIALYNRSNVDISNAYLNPHEKPEDCIFSSLYSFECRINISSIKCEFTKEKLKQESVNLISKKMKDTILMSMNNTNMYREYADKLLFILELSICYNKINPSQNTIKEFAHNFSKDFVDYKMYKEIQSISNSSNSSLWLKEIIFSPFIWRPCLTDVIKNWLHNQYLFTDEFEIGSLIIDFFIILENDNFLTAEQEDLLIKALRRMLYFKQCESDFDVILCLFKRSTTEKLKISLLSLVPTLSDKGNFSLHICNELIKFIGKETTPVVLEIILAIYRINIKKFNVAAFQIISAIRKEQRDQIFDAFIPLAKENADFVPFLCGFISITEEEKIHELEKCLSKPCNNYIDLWYLLPTILLLNNPNQLKILKWIITNFAAGFDERDALCISYLVLLRNDPEKFVFNKFAESMCRDLPEVFQRVLSNLFIVATFSSVQEKNSRIMKTKLLMESFKSINKTRGIIIKINYPEQMKIELKTAEDVLAFAMIDIKDFEFIFSGFSIDLTQDEINRAGIIINNKLFSKLKSMPSQRLIVNSIAETNEDFHKTINSIINEIMKLVDPVNLSSKFMYDSLLEKEIQNRKSLHFKL